MRLDFDHFGQLGMQAAFLRLRANYYDYTRRVQDSASDRILWRFVRTIYHDLISRRSLSARYSTIKDSVAFVVAIIGESGPYDSKIVKSDVTHWAKDGGKLRALADQMGGLGCFFLFPAMGDSYVCMQATAFGSDALMVG